MRSAFAYRCKTGPLPAIALSFVCSVYAEAPYKSPCVVVGGVWVALLAGIPRAMLGILHHCEWLISGLCIKECLLRCSCGVPCKHKRRHCDHGPAVAYMIPSCDNDRTFSTTLCVKQRLPLLIGKFLTTGCPHRLEYSDQGFISKAHCCGIRTRTLRS